MITLIEFSGRKTMHWTEEHEASLEPWKPRRVLITQAEMNILKQREMGIYEWGAMVAHIEQMIAGWRYE